MISKRMLSLLTAVTIGASAAASVAVVAPSAIASEQTMADRYQPHYVQTTQSAETSFRVPLESDAPLPPGTTFTLLGINVSDYLKSGDGLLVHMQGKSDIWVQRSKYGEDWTTKGRSTSVEILVTYPDGSSEIVGTEVTFLPQDNMVYDPSYPHIQVTAGESVAVNVESNFDLPEGTLFNLTDSVFLDELGSEGWVVEVQPSGRISVAAPEETPASSFKILIVALYPDGTSDLMEIPITVLEPEPPHSETYDVTYGVTAAMGGESFTATPDQADLPAGTEITLGDNSELIAQGWNLDVTADGELTATAPADADGTFRIALTVTYPDGTTEATTVEVAATPAPKDSEPEGDDTPNRPKAGGSSFGSS